MSAPTDESADDLVPRDILRWSSMLHGVAWTALASELSQWAVLAIIVFVGGKTLYECVKAIKSAWPVDEP